MGAIAIDWSGDKRPKGKIWLGHAVAGELVDLQQLPGREDAIDRLVAHLQADRAAVGGLDFAFSFPQWFVHEHAANAFDFWDVVAGRGEEWLAECQPPFWGRPGRKKPDLSSHFRRTETETGAVGGISPKSCFQIGGAGAVGTGTIRGIPFLRRIREAGIAIWPFDPATFPLVVEIYPRTLTGAVTKSSRDHRVDYLRRNWPGLSESMRELATYSEDSFDTAVSALVMDRQMGMFHELPAADDISRIEGMIWSPLPAPASSLFQPPSSGRARQ